MHMCLQNGVLTISGRHHFLPPQLLVCCSCRCRLFTSSSFTRMPPMLHAQAYLRWGADVNGDHRALALQLLMCCACTQLHAFHEHLPHQDTPCA